MNYTALLSFVLLGAAVSVHAADLYVSPTGSDAGAGTSRSQPLLTLQKADTLVKPGDTVWIMDGSYRNRSADKGGGSSTLLTINTSGTAVSPITWRSLPGQHPELIAQGCWYAIRVHASYIVIDGLTLTGNNDNVRQAAAEANAEVDPYATERSAAKLDETNSPTLLTNGQRPPATPPARPKPVGFEPPSPLFNGGGITVDNRGGTDFAHHVTIRNCTVRKFGGGSIGMLSTDYYTVENCEIYDNEWYGRYGGSGFSQLGGRNFDNAPGYHNIIRNNRVWRNKSLVRCTMDDRYTDGNGIILDTLDDGAYSGAVLVANNLVYDNGGAGIHVFRSSRSRIDIVNNTLWRNQQLWQLYDMGAYVAKNVRFLNNIVMPDKWRQTIGDTKDGGVQYDYNLYYGGSFVGGKGPHDLVADPLFVRPSTNYKAADFRLRPDSPALKSGIAEACVPSTDRDGRPRPKNAPDRGAFQQ